MLDRVVLERSSPKQVSSARVEVKLEDSLVAQGLSECRLVANFDASHEHSKGVHIRTGPDHSGTFRCLTKNETDSTLVEFGQAVLQPGNVTVPLLLPKDLANELHTGSFFSDSAETGDSLTDAMEALGDSIAEAQESKMDSVREQTGHLAESLRVVGRRRVDSLKQAAHGLADSAHAASLRENAARPR
jgi:hypothetical protein